jgi:hypothetical protein
VGTWTLVSADVFGPSPKGALMFDANGHVSAHLMRSDIPKYASNNRAQGTPEEYKATVHGGITYFGTYSLNGTDLLFHIEGSSFPNWNGTDQKAVLLYRLPLAANDRSVQQGPWVGLNHRWATVY